MSRYAILDSQWNVIKDHMPGRIGTKGVTAKDNRLFFDALIHMARAGCPWRDLPKEFGKWNSVFKRYDRWAKSGVLNKILDLLTVESDFEWVMVDSSVIRAHQSAAGAKGGQKNQSLGRSKGGFSTKIHLAVDSFGNPIRVELTGGEVHDSQRSKSLIKGIPAENVLADKGYDSNEFRQSIIEMGAQPVIPPRSNRKTAIDYDRHLYKERNMIERTFNKLKHYRKIATRYDKKAANFMGYILLGSIMLHLR
jgi:transposase